MVAKRARIVRPDGQISGIGPDGEDILIQTVSPQAVANAVLAAVQVQDFNGGVIEVLVARTPTGFPHERVTTAAAVQWKDRTDARPQPESDGPVIATSGNAPLPVEDDEPAVVEPDLTGLETGVDESSVPVHLREA